MQKVQGFHAGDFYEFEGEHAKVVGKCLGLTLNGGSRATARP